MRSDHLSKLVVASHNAGKIREIVDLLLPLGIEVSSALQHQVPDVEETESSFEGNARLKAVAVCGHTGLAALGDDSGLMVDALNGAPGIYTARWAGEPRDFNRAMRKVADKLWELNTTNWRARFVCVLALALPDGTIEIERGEVKGELVWPLRGQNGFGFDPMFVPDGHKLTFGEMSPEEKNAMNHRQRAFEKMLKNHLR